MQDFILESVLKNELTYIGKITMLLQLLDQDSSVSIVTCYGLDGPGIESQWRRDFPRPSRPAHPDYYTIGTGSFPRVSSLGMALTTHPHLALRLKEE
jgi:hypothetical protein